MTQVPVAHSARPEFGIPAQLYWDHVRAVMSRAEANASAAAHYWTGRPESLQEEVRAAALLHDCGKLCPENQAVLAGSGAGKLPIRHEDAGAEWLLDAKRETSALLVYSHHRGLPSIQAEKVKIAFNPPGKKFRMPETVEHTAQNRELYRSAYSSGGMAPEFAAEQAGARSGLLHRIGLSCLVDADHGDTASHYGDARAESTVEPRWDERIRKLDEYVASLSAAREHEPRNRLRQAVYSACAGADLERGIRSCDASVGSGKTTAVMAHLLRVAREHGLRRVFVVLPYTNIIQQSVKTYRSALTLDGEDPERSVAELHHLADFANPESRKLAALWDAPVVVTTAVQFFETMAACQPARLRKLHQLPGSAVFLDEAHAAIPVHLWPQTWLWLKELTREWGCHFVLASGSLARFWALKEVSETPETGIADLLPDALREDLGRAEGTRIQYEAWDGTLNLDELERFVLEKPGPRLVILNTVQNAAVLASRLHERGERTVLHLSTALTPADRARIVARVERRLLDPHEEDWTLVATSCVEAGVDFSFRSAIRESASAASVVQTGGRINRHGVWETGVVWSVKLQDPRFNRHPAFEDSRRVLAMLFEKYPGLAAPASNLMTEALMKELRLNSSRDAAGKLRKSERLRDYPEVAELYQVIAAGSKLVVVEPSLIARLESGAPVSSRDLIRGSVHMWAQQAARQGLPAVRRHPELYQWNGPYQPEFLGYMAGVLPQLDAKETGGYVA